MPPQKDVDIEVAGAQEMASAQKRVPGGRLRCRTGELATLHEKSPTSASSPQHLPTLSDSKIGRNSERLVKPKPRSKTFKRSEATKILLQSLRTKFRPLKGSFSSTKDPAPDSTSTINPKYVPNLLDDDELGWQS